MAKMEPSAILQRLLKFYKIRLILRNFYVFFLSK